MSLAKDILYTFKNFKTFTSRDVRIALSEHWEKVSEKTIQVTISRMVKRGQLYPVIKGVFSLQKRDEVAGFAFAPFYYGGRAALMIRDLADDQVKMEIMTTQNVKRSFVSIYNGSSRVVLHHLPKKYYFGFEDFKYGDIVVPVSDPEKTLIDLFYYRTRLSIQDYNGLLHAINATKVRRYLKNYDQHTSAAVINFVKKYKKLSAEDKLETGY